MKKDRGLLKLNESLSWTGTLFAVSLIAGCSLSTGEPRIRVTMPSQNGQMGLNFGAGLMNLGSVAPPATFSGFDCFALNVIGSGISRAPLCPMEPTAGALGGFAPFSGGTVSVRVPSGTNRTIQLIGVMTDDGTCPAVSTLVPDGPMPGLATYLIGEKTVDVFEDKQISIQAAYSGPGSAVPVIQNCGTALQFLQSAVRRPQGWVRRIELPDTAAKHQGF